MDNANFISRKKFIESDFINKFSLDNKNSGAIFSFIGKVRPKIKTITY